MAVYSIHYDLNGSNKDYTGLQEAIKNCGSVWWHYLDSTWLVSTNLEANAIYEKLKPHLDKDDHALIIGVTSDYSGWLPEKAWVWIRKYI